MEVDAKRTISENYYMCILLLLTISQFVMSMGAYAWGPLAPFLRMDFGITRAQIGVIVSALYAAAAIVAVPSGLAVDKWGAKPMLLIALVIMGFSFGVLSIVDSFPIFVFFAGISGSGYGMISQISSKGIIRWFKKRNRATAMGIKQAGVTLGGALAAFLLPAISILWTRHWATAAIGSFMLFIAVMVCLFYREYPEAEHIKDEISEFHIGGRLSNWRKDVGILLVKPELIILCLAALMLSASQTSIASFLVLYMQEELRASTAMAGMSLLVFMMGGTLGRVLWGIISDRYFKGDRQNPMILLCLIAIGSAIGMIFLTCSSFVWLSYILCAVMGFTFMGWSALFITLTAEIAGPALVGLATGLTMTLAGVGVITGPPVFGLIADKLGYSWGWAMLAVLGFLCAISILAHSEMRKDLNYGSL